MRLRTPLASVWIDDVTPVTDHLNATSAPAATASSPKVSVRTQPSSIRWANKAYAGKLGRVVAVRLRGDVLQVAISSPEQPLYWVQLSQVLTEAQASKWLKESF